MTRSKRGRCPECHRDITIRKDGFLRHHGGPILINETSDARTPRRESRCEGGGQLAVEAWPEDTRIKYWQQHGGDE